MERIPIFKVGDILLVTIQTDVRDRLLENFQGEVGAKIRDTGARGVLIDISALEVIDHFMARMLGQIAAVTRLLGAETVLVGMGPTVALTLMELGRTLDGVATALNVESGMELLRSKLDSSEPEVEDDEEVAGQEAKSSEEDVDRANQPHLP